ncbi:phytanoyl-CoA dioxygenase family protein [Pendulispora albinea]|uniref:Phytanoyl-CoA dioxygenase family protein n=1 Tax=Pendulispora albinea TaxID=2741071 RepID=A0ABZ2M8I3_9BACT
MLVNALVNALGNVPEALGRETLAAAVAHFHEHGYASLGRIADEDTVRALARRADALMLGEVQIPGLFFQLDSATGNYDDLTFGLGYQGPSLEYRKLEKLELDPLYRAWIENPVFEQVVRAIVGDDVVLYRAILMNKSASGGTPLPWHQDGGRFWGLDREPTLQIWTALDDAPIASGCVEVLPGSHHAGLVTPLGGLVQQPFVDARGADRAAVPLPARAGDVILLHNHLWHRSGRNTTGKPRRAFSVCYMDAATRCLRKKRAPRTFTRVFASSS